MSGTPDKVKVYCRIRPRNRNEKTHGECVTKSNDSVRIKNNKDTKNFLFDHVYGPNVSFPTASL